MCLSNGLQIDPECQRNKRAIRKWRTTVLITGRRVIRWSSRLLSLYALLSFRQAVFLQLGVLSLCRFGGGWLSACCDY